MHNWDEDLEKLMEKKLKQYRDLAENMNNHTQKYLGIKS